MRSPGGGSFLTNMHSAAVAVGLASQATLPADCVIDSMHPLLLVLLINECH